MLGLPAATFKEYPPRSYPPSFVPTTIMEETLHDLREAQKQRAHK
jgi:arylsulfatase